MKMELSLQNCDYLDYTYILNRKQSEHAVMRESSEITPVSYTAVKIIRIASIVCIY